LSDFILYPGKLRVNNIIRIKKRRTTQGRPLAKSSVPGGDLPAFDWFSYLMAKSNLTCGPTHPDKVKTATQSASLRVVSHTTDGMGVIAWRP
jgi:hypothetical protein